MVEFSEQSPALRKLVFKAVLEQPGGAFGITGIALFGIVDPVFHPAGKGQAGKAVADADGGRRAFQFGRRIRIFQRSQIQVGAQIETLGHGQLDTGRMDQPGLAHPRGHTVLPGKCWRCPNNGCGNRTPYCLSWTYAVIGAFVLERVIHIQRGPVAVEELGSQIGAGSQIAAGKFAEDLETVGQPPTAADADPAVVLALAGCPKGFLDKPVSGPALPGIIAHAGHGIGQVPLFLVATGSGALSSRLSSRTPALSVQLSNKR